MKNSFFDINSVAVIWASEAPKKIWNDLLINLRDFSWEKFWVNPKWWSFEGITFYESIDLLPVVVDVVVLAIPAKFVVWSMKEIAKKWIKRAIIISAWFKEIWNIKEEEEIEQIAKENNISILWPNCLWYIDTFNNLNLSFWSKEVKKWNIAMISQSWAMAVAFTDWANNHDLGFSKIISMWNKSDVSEIELLLELEHDEKTDVIVIYLESIEKGREFFDIAKRLTVSKPIILVKSWMSDKWSLAASSHTWALAWSAVIFRTAFKQSGIIYTSKLEDFFLWWKAFSQIIEWHQDIKNIPEEIAIVTNAGWPWVMVTDHWEYLWLKFTEFTDDEKEILRVWLPEAASVNNPIDIIWDATSVRYKQILENLKSLDKKRAILLMLTPQTTTDTDNIARIIVDFKKENPDFFVMVSFMWWSSIKNAEDILKEKWVLEYTYPQKALLAYSQILRYKHYSSDFIKDLSLDYLDKEQISEVKNILKNENKLCSSESLWKIMNNLELPFVHNHLVNSEDEALKIFDKIWAKKIIARISSEDIPHKTDIGGVILWISDTNEALEAYKTIMKNVSEKEPNANIEWVIYSVFIEQSNDLRELFIWLKRDVTFWNVLIIWMGGIYVNVYEDVSRRLSPVWKEEILEMFKSLKWYKILAWYRWIKTIDFDKVSDIILKFIQLFEQVEKINEIDINPLFSSSDENYLVDVKLYL